METEKRFKKRYALLLLIVMLFGPKLYSYINYELTKDNLAIGGLDKIEYNDLADLEEYLHEVNYLISASELNNLIYTIKEDNLEDWYYDFVYNYRGRNEGILVLWFIHDLTINDQYCHTKMVDDEYCYVSENETKNLSYLIYEDKTEISEIYGVGIVESSTNGRKFYDSARGAELLEQIDLAYVVTNGPKTPGYNQAMDKLYSFHPKNGGRNSKETFVDAFHDNMNPYKSELSKIEGKGMSDLIDSYSEDKEVIKALSGELRL